MSGFSQRQLRVLRDKLDPGRVKTRMSNGATLSYLEGWYLLSEANRTFGYDGWDRETIETRCVWHGRDLAHAACSYVARVRVRVYAGSRVVVREANGAGHGRADTVGEAHASAVKEAETDATKRALVTFGNCFGLALYDPLQRGVRSHCHASDMPSDAGSVLADQPMAPAEGQDSKKLAEIAPMLQRPVRRRDRAHLRFVAQQPCLVCGRLPGHAHHVNFLQARGLGQKASDEFTVPLCALHHRALHDAGNEVSWWSQLNIDPAPAALTLWHASRGTRVEDELPPKVQTKVNEADHADMARDADGISHA